MPAQVNLASIGLFVLAALLAVRAVVGLVNRQAIVDRALEQTPAPPARGMPMEALESAATTAVVAAAIVTLVVAGLFLWLGIMARKGRNWARITATVFLAIGIVLGLVGLSGGGLAINTALTVAALAVEVAVVILLWLRPSSAYFSAEKPA